MHKDFVTRKSVHVNLPTEVHANLRILAFKCKLSMQEIFEELAIRLVEDDVYMRKMLSSLTSGKRDKALRDLSSPDRETIFDAIEKNNPLDETF